jgi:hypothetical protein
MKKNYVFTGKMIALMAAVLLSAPMRANGGNGIEPTARHSRVAVDGENFVHMAVSSGYNEDIIANGVGPLSASTTNDVDDANYVFLSKGLQLSESAEAITFGLEIDGLISSLTSPITYQLASYTGSNALRLAEAGSQGTVQFSNAQSLAKLFLLVTSANGANISGTINFTDGTTQEIASTAVPSWFDQGGLPMAARAVGRGNTDSNQLDNFPDAPNLFQLEVMITGENQMKMVSGVTITKSNGGATVFSLMGATGLLVTEAPQNSQPLSITSGFNFDIIANGVGALSTSTNNDADGFNYAFVAQGLQISDSDAPLAYGLPQNGMLDNIAQGPNYQLGSYSENNTLRLNTANPSGTVMFGSAVAAESMYLLVTSSNGANVGFTLRFSDGTTQEATSVEIPGWFSNTRILPTVATAVGRGRISTNGLESFINAPNLFQVVIPVSEENVTKQVEGVAATLAGTSETVFNLMAVSALRTDLGSTDQWSSKVGVYPNPVKDVLNIANADNVSEISILSLSGQLLKTEKSNVSQVSFSGLAAGIYFVKVTSATGGNKTIKVVKI